MKKRLAILISVSLWASAMLTGCGNNSDSTDGGAASVEDSAPAVEETAQADGEENTAGGGDSDNIVIWAFTEPHAEYFRWVTEEYKKEHADVDFTIEVMEINALSDRLSVINASGGDGAPDFVDMEQGQFPRFMSEEQMCFYPLDEFIERDSVAEKMVLNRLDLYSYDGHYYGLEHALCPVTMAYREDLFEEYGVKVPETWEEYMAAAEQFAEHGIYMAVAKDMAMGGDLDELVLMLRPAGCDIVDANGDLNITDEFKTLVMDFIEMQQNGQLYAYETQEEAWPVYADDKVATYFTADWAAGWLRDNVPEQSGKWTMTALPKLTADSGTVSVRGGTGLCMTKYTDKDKESLWDFMTFAMLNKENCITKYEMIALYPPVYEAMAECSSPVEYYGGQNLGALYEELTDEIPIQYQADWKSIFNETFTSNAYDLTEGNITIDEMAEILTEAVTEYNESK